MQGVASVPLASPGTLAGEKTRETSFREMAVLERGARS